MCRAAIVLPANAIPVLAVTRNESIRVTISPAGKIVAVLPLHARGMLAATVPLIDAVTFASRAGSLFPLGCAALAAMLVVGRWRVRLTSGARTPDI